MQDEDAWSRGRNSIEISMDQSIWKRCLAFAGVAMFLSWLAPNHYPPWTSFHAEAIAALAWVPMIVWAVFRHRAIGLAPRSVLALAALPIAQLVLGQIAFAGDAWTAALYIAGFGLTLLVGQRLAELAPADGPQCAVIAPLQAAILCAALVSVGVGMHQWLNLGLLALLIADLPPGGRPFANFAQPNQFATLLMLAMCSTAYFFESRRIRPSIAFTAALVISFGLAMTQSRTPIIGWGIAWIAYLSFAKKASLRTTKGALAAVTAFYVLCLVGWSVLDDALLLPRGTPLADRMGENLRLTLWRAMLDSLLMAPWQGYGWGQITVAQQASALQHPALHHWFSSSHNLLLDLALWCGIPIALVLSVGLIACVWISVKRCRDGLHWSLMVGLGCILAHAMLELPLAYAYFLLPVGVVVGLLLGSPSRGAVMHRTTRMTSFVLAAVVITGGAKVLVEYLALEDEWRNLRMERAFVGGSPTPEAKGIVLLTQLQARARFMRVRVERGMSTAELDLMRDVAQRDGAVGFLFSYARAAALNGQPQNASHTLAMICKTQMPRACKAAMGDWKALVRSGLYPEFKAVALPVEGAH